MSVSSLRAQGCGAASAVRPGGQKMHHPPHRKGCGPQGRHVTEQPARMLLEFFAPNTTYCTSSPVQSLEPPTEDNVL